MAYSLGWHKADPHKWAAMVRFTPAAPLLAAVPSHFTLDFTHVPNLDQAGEGACGPHSAAECILYRQFAQSLTQFTPSRNALYWTVRKLMNTLDQDSGVDNHTMAQALAQFGFAPEALDPYSDQTLYQQPSQQYFTAAAANKTPDTASVQMDLDHVKAAIMGGTPLVIGYDVYPSMMTDAVAKTGVIPMPRRGESPEGGHDCSFFGWDDSAAVLYFRNHWRGPNGGWWGTGGNGAMPYAYFQQYASDALQIRSIPGTAPAPQPQPNPSPNPSPQPTPGGNVNIQAIIAAIQAFLATPLGQALEKALLQAAGAAGLPSIVLNLLAMLLGQAPPANASQVHASLTEFCATHGITI
jgi:hypothetical protein